MFCQDICGEATDEEGVPGLSKHKLQLHNSMHDSYPYVVVANFTFVEHRKSL
jgi:hypothetical protein